MLTAAARPGLSSLSTSSPICLMFVHKSPHIMLGSIVKTYYAKVRYKITHYSCFRHAMHCQKSRAARPEHKDEDSNVDIVITTRELAAMIRSRH